MTSLDHEVENAVKRILAAVPDATAILWSRVDDAIHIVTVLSKRSDQAILRVAQQELVLMDELKEFSFDFRTAHVSDTDAYLADGYVPVVGSQGSNSLRTL